MSLSKSRRTKIELPSVKEQPKVVEKIVEKIVEKKVLVQSICNNVNITGRAFAITPKPGSFITIGFTLTPSPTGCGLILFSNFTNSVTMTPEQREQYVFILKNSLAGIYGIMATLGDDFIRDGKAAKYEGFLLDLGFKEIHRYANKNHGTGYYQRIYFANVEDIK